MRCTTSHCLYITTATRRSRNEAAAVITSFYEIFIAQKLDNKFVTNTCSNPGACIISSITTPFRSTDVAVRSSFDRVAQQLVLQWPIWMPPTISMHVATAFTVLGSIKNFLDFIQFYRSPSRFVRTSLRDFECSHCEQRNTT